MDISVNLKSHFLSNLSLLIISFTFFETDFALRTRIVKYRWILKYHCKVSQEFQIIYFFISWAFLDIHVQGIYLYLLLLKIF